MREGGGEAPSALEYGLAKIMACIPATPRLPPIPPVSKIIGLQRLRAMNFNATVRKSLIGSHQPAAIDMVHADVVGIAGLRDVGVGGGIHARA